MSKAEEKAQAAYPAWRNGVGDEFSQNSAYYGFIEGYHQAEKDLELSWEDIRRIYLLVISVSDMQGWKGTDKSIYQEVLKRFKDLKKGKINDTTSK